MTRLTGLRSRLVARLIGTSVPYLNWFRRPAPCPFHLDDLRGLPPGSLGAETAAFLDRRGFTFLPKYEMHDVTHALLGYGTTTTGELRLQAFMAGNRSSSLAGLVLLLLGVLLLPELWGQLRQDYRRGRRAQPLNALDFAEAIRLDAGTLRQGLQIVAAPLAEGMPRARRRKDERRMTNDEWLPTSSLQPPTSVLCTFPPTQLTIRP